MDTSYYNGKNGGLSVIGIERTEDFFYRLFNIDKEAYADKRDKGKLEIENTATKMYNGSNGDGYTYIGLRKALEKGGYFGQPEYNKLKTEWGGGGEE